MKGRVGQSIAEYALLIAVVTTAIMAMNVYIKRGVQAGIKISTDQFANQSSVEFQKKPNKFEINLYSVTRNNQSSTNRVYLTPGTQGNISRDRGVTEAVSLTYEYQ